MKLLTVIGRQLGMAILCSQVATAGTIPNVNPGDLQIPATALDLNKLIGQINASITAVSTGGGSGTNIAINVKSAPYSAICDGGAHPLSGQFGSLAAAQAVYPFITSLTQQVDYAAIKLASNTALGADGSEHGTTNPQLNRPIYIPAGICNLGSDTWKISKGDGVNIFGDGTTATQIKSTAIVLQTDGLWYSSISNIYFNRTGVSGTEPALDIDGNVSHSGATNGVQGDIFTNLLVNGGANSYAVAVCRQGQSFGQCSEMVWVGLHLQNAIFAPYYQNGFNAVDNVLLGGDIQNYTKHGIYLLAGSIKVFGMSFESTTGYTQITNSGCDIYAADAGAGDSILAYGSRTESLCFYKGGGSQLADIRGMTHIPSIIGTWTATTNYALGQMSTFLSGGLPFPYRVTTAGQSGSVVPTADTSPVTDGTVVWTYSPYFVVNVISGWFDQASSTWEPSASTAIPAAFQTGTPFPLFKSTTGGFFVNGTNGGLEECLAAQAPIICFYVNPNAAQALKSGITYPGTSQGMAVSTSEELSLVGASINFRSPSTAQQLTFANRGTCNGSVKGYEIFITDATDPGRAATIAAGGGGGVKAICNGTNWVAE